MRAVHAGVLLLRHYNRGLPSITGLLIQPILLPKIDLMSKMTRIDK